MKSVPPSSVHVLRISLNDMKPPIWRLVAVSSDISLARLHSVIQRSMGWYDDHLHQFIAGKKVRERMTIPESSLIRSILPEEGAKLIYEYDFGDSWLHTITVKGIVDPEPSQHYPVCLDGARACPPEDSGGVWGYAEKLQDLSDPSSPGYEDTLDWMGEYDPEEFSIDIANQRLRGA